MSTRPHIAIDALNLARGGGVVVMARLAEAFARAGWQVTVLASRPIFDTHALPDGVTLSMHPEAAGAVKSALFRRFKLDGATAHTGVCDAVAPLMTHGYLKARTGP